jgi:cytochrome c-type biogenesis protein CcmH
VLLKPRFTVGTALLWLAPLIALIGGGCGIAIALRRRRAAVESREPAAALNPAEQRRVAELLERSERQPF